MTEKKNKKSDVLAKQAFIKELETRGVQARVTGAPADITATRDGETWYFEIKMTHRTDRYFGAATMTEWKQALKDSAHYRFVVVKADETDTVFEFKEYSVEEFMQYSTIPPFKVYFNIDLQGESKRKRRKNNGAVSFSEMFFEKMLKLYKEMKEKSE